MFNGSTIEGGPSLGHRRTPRASLEGGSLSSGPNHLFRDGIAHADPDLMRKQIENKRKYQEQQAADRRQRKMLREELDGANRQQDARREKKARGGLLGGLGISDIVATYAHYAEKTDRRMENSSNVFAKTFWSLYGIVETLTLGTAHAVLNWVIKILANKSFHPKG